jgi:hypothetical protein
MNNRRYQRFEDFWPYYVTEHANPLNRKLHFWGTNNLFLWLMVALVRRSPRLVVFAVISSYAYAWIGHFLIENNRPATLDYPILSALGDLQMYVKTWQGQMDNEVARYVQSGQPNARLTSSATTSGVSQ